MNIPAAQKCHGHYFARSENPYGATVVHYEALHLEPWQEDGSWLLDSAFEERL